MKPCQTSLNKHPGKEEKKRRNKERGPKYESLWGIGRNHVPEPPIILIDH
jgi:hypothetical protein